MKWVLRWTWPLCVGMWYWHCLMLNFSCLKYLDKFLCVGLCTVTLYVLECVDESLCVEYTFGVNMCWIYLRVLDCSKYNFRVLESIDWDGYDLYGNLVRLKQYEWPKNICGGTIPGVPLRGTMINIGMPLRGTMLNHLGCLCDCIITSRYVVVQR